MSVAVVVDRTSTGKEHFEVLDGLRGSAAFLIVIFHVFNYSFGFHGAWALVKHAYLAVDFFFALSGFVVAYAYDDRWVRMSILQLFRIRLIRLHPLVLILGLHCCCYHCLRSGEGITNLRHSMGRHGL